MEQYDAIPAGDPVRLAKRTSNLFRPRASERDARARRVRARRRALGRPGGPHRRRAGDDDVRAPRRRDPGARADAARRPAAEDHHPRRRGHRARHRVVVLPQRAAARVGARDRGAHRRRRGRRGARRTASTPTCSAPSPTPTARSATRCGCGSSSSRCIAVRPAAARPVPRPRRARRGDRRRSSTAGRATGEPVDFLDGTVFSRRRGLPDPRARWADDGAVHLGLHRQRDLLPVDPVPRRRLPDGARLPLALGHRLVLVLAGVRRAEPADPPGLAQALPAQRRLLEDASGSRTATTSQRGSTPAAARPPRERVVQDVEIPLERTAEFLRWFLREVPIEPVWLCPMRLRDDGPSAIYAGEHQSHRGRSTRSSRGEPYVNVGFWSTVPIEPRVGPTATSTGAIEAEVTELGGHKSLYSDAYYGEDEFWALYGGADYDAASRSATTRRSRLLDLYAKAVQAAMSLRAGQSPGARRRHGDARRDLRARSSVPDAPVRFAAYDGSTRGRRRRADLGIRAGRPRGRCPTSPRPPGRSAWPGRTSRATSRSTASTRATPTSCSS